MGLDQGKSKKASRDRQSAWTVFDDLEKGTDNLEPGREIFTIRVLVILFLEGKDLETGLSPSINQQDLAGFELLPGLVRYWSA
jgi:hypothetical protein